MRPWVRGPTDPQDRLTCRGARGQPEWQGRGDSRAGVPLE